MKTKMNKKLARPEAFVGHFGTPAIQCSFGAVAGYLYPLQHSFIYIYKPPLHIPFKDVHSIHFARSAGNLSLFDFVIELNSRTVYAFRSIKNEEFGKLFDFIKSKKLHVYHHETVYKDLFGNSDNKAELDRSLEPVKTKVPESEDKDNQNDDDDVESSDEDFIPGQTESDVPEEYNSMYSSSSDEEESDDLDSTNKERTEEIESTSANTVVEKLHKKHKCTKNNKRPGTPFLLWLNDTRALIRTTNSGTKVTENGKNEWGEKAEAKRRKSSDSENEKRKKRSNSTDKSENEVEFSSVVSVAGSFSDSETNSLSSSNIL